MTKTLEALEKFAQALPPTPAAVGQQCPVPLPASETPLAEVPAQRNYAAVAAPPAHGPGREPDPRVASRDAAVGAEGRRAQAWEYPAPQAAGCSGALQAASGSQPFTAPSVARAAAVKGEAAGKSSPAGTRSEGTTRRGSGDQWQRLLGMAVLVVTVGVGLKLLVRTSERAGEAYWRQGIGKSLSHPHHAAARRHSSAAP
jgi:hypothetical protein